MFSEEDVKVDTLSWKVPFLNVKKRRASDVNWLAEKLGYAGTNVQD